MSLRAKVLLPLAAFSIVLVAYLYAYWMPLSLANIEAGFQQSIEKHLDSVDEGLVPLLLGRQLDAVYENLDRLMAKNKDWIDLSLTDPEGRILYPLIPRTSTKAAAGNDVHFVERRIKYLDRDLGSLALQVDFGPRLSELRKRHWELTLVLLGVVLVFVVTTGVFLDRLVVRPVKLLSHASRKLAENDFNVPVEKVGEDEVGVLVDDFDGMRSALREYRFHLQNIHEQLQLELAERRKAEQELREAHKRLLTVLNSLDAIVYVADMNTYETLFINKYLEDICGDVIGKQCWQSLQSGQSGPCGYCTNKYLLAPGGEPAGVYQWEFRNTRDGRWYDNRDRAIQWVDGRYVRLEIATDITRRKETEEALLKSREVVERIFSMTTTCIAYLDRDFNFIRVNKEYAEADGKTPEYFTGKNHFALFPNAENEAIFRNVVQTGEQYRVHAKPFEYRNHPERGVTHWDWSLTPVRDAAGEVEALILSLINVTERVMAQEGLARLNDELEERIRGRTRELEEKNRELERLNKIFVNRELRMVELKDRIRELEEGLRRTS